MVDCCWCHVALYAGGPGDVVVKIGAISTVDPKFESRLEGDLFWIYSGFILVDYCGCRVAVYIYI